MDRVFRGTTFVLQRFQSYKSEAAHGTIGGSRVRFWISALCCRSVPGNHKYRQTDYYLNCTSMQRFV